MYTKSHHESMIKLKAQIQAKREQVSELKRALEDAEREGKACSTNEENNRFYDKKREQLIRYEEQLANLTVRATDGEENKKVALGTSKVNYLDPRVTVQWCKKHEIPIDQVFNKKQREKFQWAIDMADQEYSFRPKH